MASAAVEQNPFWRDERTLQMTAASSSLDRPLVESSEKEAEPLHLMPSATNAAVGHVRKAERPLSTFERVLSTHPPVLESVLAHTPSASLLNLFYTSRFLQSFFEQYPLAWRSLSFRLPQPMQLLASPGADTPSGSRESKRFALDGLLTQMILPLATCLKSLDLDNTMVGGVALTAIMLERRDTLEHLSVRGCKEVSIKYHIVPFLTPYTHSRYKGKQKLALKSLYTYRCRHHRRRPYLPSSLTRRDSDSEPTHELIEICHQLGIWTDTAWCPTPGGRCFRRKDYHGNRAAPGTSEVWVPFDRLWRSGNRIGPADGPKEGRPDGRLWEDQEHGHEGEALGTETTGESKYLPAHLRKSHTTFIEDIKCDQCGEKILERCETCSIKMHCMGCRKTLCGSCAFNRPVHPKRTKIRHFPSLLGMIHPSFAHSFSQSPAATPPGSSRSSRSNSKGGKDKFWWAPGATRSPNVMSELPMDSDSDEEPTNAFSPLSMTNLLSTPAAPLKLNMHWCCIEPIFSGGGGVAFLGPGQLGPGADRIRAVPLPKKKEYEDPDFQHHLVDPSSIEKLKNVRLYEEIMGENVDILPYLAQDSLDIQTMTCPRSLCQDCYRSFRWRVACRGCKRPLCKEHDFRGLKIRKCGFRELSVERDYVRNPPPSLQTGGSLGKGKWELAAIPAFRRARAGPLGMDFGSGASTPVPTVVDEEEGTSIPMARIASTASSSAESLQVGRPPTVAHLEAAIQNLDMTASVGMADLPPRSIPGSSRQRSVSLSGLSEKTLADTGGSCFASNAPGIGRADVQKRHLLPGNPNHPVQWQGCGAYFCHQVRPTGDPRPRCSAQFRKCTECAVLVCEYCNVSSCPCGFCGSNYHCPVCAVKPAIKALCTREEEVSAMERLMQKERERRKMEEEQRVWADEVAEAVGEFYLAME